MNLLMISWVKFIYSPKPKKPAPREITPDSTTEDMPLAVTEPSAVATKPSKGKGMKLAVPARKMLATTERPLYPWNRNSCWLDTSLQLLYVALLRCLDDFTGIYQALPAKSVLKVVLASLLQRHNLESQDNNGAQMLENERDKIRKLLKLNKAIKGITLFESLFVGISSSCSKFTLLISELVLVC